MSLKSYRDLIYWQKSMDLVTMVYKLTSKLPKDEVYSLCNQMRRAAISIPSNIAEGYDRGSQKNYINFLHIASGSNSELQTQLEICVRIGYFSKEEVKPIYELSVEVAKMLYVALSTLQKKQDTKDT